MGRLLVFNHGNHVRFLHAVQHEIQKVSPLWQAGKDQLLRLHSGIQCSQIRRTNNVEIDVVELEINQARCRYFKHHRQCIVKWYGRYPYDA